MVHLQGGCQLKLEKHALIKKFTFLRRVITKPTRTDIKKRNEDCSFIFISEYVQDLSLYLKTTETASFTFLIKSISYEFNKLPPEISL